MYELGVRSGQLRIPQLEAIRHHIAQFENAGMLDEHKKDMSGKLETEKNKEKRRERQDKQRQHKKLPPIITRVRIRPETVAYWGAGDMASGHWAP